MTSDRLHPFDFESPAGRPQPPSTRRHHVGQPPTLLTTALSAAHSQNTAICTASQPPQSATSLSAPFSPYQHSAYSPFSNAHSRESSPMASRAQPAFSAPYNPQQWGPLSSSTSSPLEVASRTHQSSHTTRVPRFAPRLRGPDGMGLEHAA